MAEFLAETLEQELHNGIKELVNNKKKYFHIEVHSPVQLELQLTVTTLTNKLILFHRVFISSTSQFSLHSWQLLQWT